MEDHSPYQIPQDIDSPIPIFQWDVVEIVAAIAVVGLFTILRLFPIGIIAAGFVLWGAKKVKAGSKRGQVQHLMWRLGLNLDTPLKRFGPKPLRIEYMK